MTEPITIGVDHGYAAMKTAHCSFPSGLAEYEHEPYTQKNVLCYDGKYYVDSMKHSVGKSGYKIQITLHKVQKAIKVTAPVASSSGKTYTVVSGDTLWGISKKFYGTGTKYGIIYNANADLIESTAKSHGKKSSDNGHWIWPGETFTIPEV